MSWIQTVSGRKFPLLEPHEDQIDIEDIAHALANLCRFTGHVKWFHSVAHHCVLVAHQVQDWGGGLTAQRLALLHDATEAYIGDLSRPLKKKTPVGPPYLEAEGRLARAILRRFELEPTPEDEALVDRADVAVLFAEARDLLPGGPRPDWELNQGTTGIEPSHGTVRPLPPAAAKRIFLAAADRLGLRPGGDAREPVQIPA